jgi:hypothetical protein
MAINSSVSEFLGKIKQGVRNNLFVVDIAYPSGQSPVDVELTNIMCKSAALPASNLGVIEVPFRGRTVKIAGDRTFDTWTATFINDRDFKIRHAMEAWMQSMNAHDANTASRYIPGFGATSGTGAGGGGNSYLADIRIKQLERDTTTGGSLLRAYKLFGCFPTNISQIDLAYDSNDQIEDFTVEFQLQYWTVDNDGQGVSPGIIP